MKKWVLILTILFFAACTGSGGNIPGPDDQIDQNRTGPYHTDRMSIDDYTVTYPEGEGPFPVLLWGNGLGGSPRVYRGLHGHLASHGFVVVATNDSNTSTSDVLGGLDVAEDINIDERSILFGKLDMNLVGAIGHSMGGGAAVSAAKNENIDCSVAIQPVSASTVDLNGPIFLITSTKDTVISPSSVKSMYNKANGVALFGEIQGADHFLPVDGVGNPSAYNLRGYIAAWFLYYLYGDNDSDLFFANCVICGDPNWEVERKNF